MHDVVIKAEEITVVTQLEGKPVPFAYYVNYLGWGYGNFLIDDRSLEAFRIGLSKIKDGLTRELIYNSISKMVTDGRAPAHLFLDIIRNHMASESNMNLISTMLSSKVPSFLRYYVPKENYTEEADKMFEFLLNEFLPKVENEEIKQHVISAIISVGSSDKHKEILQKWLINKKPFYLDNGEQKDISANLTIGNRHTILKKISTSLKLNNAEFQELFEKQMEEDSKDGDLVSRCKLSIEAAKFDKEVKAKFMDELLAAKCDRSIWDQRAIAATLMPLSQEEIVKPLVDRFFEEIPIVFKNRLRDERDAIYYALHPLQFASEELLKKYEDCVR